MGKLLIIVGILFVGAGLLFSYFKTIPWLGKLPGDFSYQGENFSFYFPLATSLLLSVIISFLIYLFSQK